MSGRSLYGTIRISNGDGDGDDDDDAIAINRDDHDDEASPLLLINDENKEGSPPPKVSSSSFNESLHGYWSYLTFDWISPLLEKGNANGQLSAEDLEMWPLPRDCQTDEVYAVFCKCWEDELGRVAEARARANANSRNGLGAKTMNKNNGDGGSETEKKKTAKDKTFFGSSSDEGDEGLMEGLYEDDIFDAYNHQPSLIRTLYNAYGSDFVRAGLLKLVHDSCLFVGPQVLNRLIHFLRDPDAPLSYGFSLMLAVTCSQITISICLRHYFYKCTSAGLRIRTAVVIAIYKKSLVLSLKERHARGGPGQIANLVGIDAQRLQDLLTYLHAVWYSFFQIGLAMYFLFGQVGPSCLAGLVVILLMIPTTNFVARFQGRIQKTLMKARDARTSLNSEMLGAMKVIKIQAWEENFRTKLLSLRNAELERLWRYFLTSGISVTMYSSAPLLVALATFWAYTAVGETLDVATALTALALFDIIRFPMIMLPQIVNSIVEAGISVERIREFLLSEEYIVVGEGTLKENGEVWMNNGTFVYDSKKPRFEGEGGAGAGNNGGIKGLLHHHQRMMKEANFDRSWEMLLLKAQLKDAEGAIKVLEKEIRPKRSIEGNDRNDGQEGKWSPSSLLSLRRVCMNCQPGDFVAVVGGVGAGKSTLINSILGEGRPLTGSELAVKGKLGAFLQTPFIMNETVRENILFGHTGNIDEERYQLALKVCSLSHDLKLLPHGDKTEIGEKGITLSGGQKARVALARAVYHDADIYLLDDPLAAVDAHVGKDLFNKCIVDELLLGKSKVNTLEQKGEQTQDVANYSHGWTDMLLGRSPSKLGADDGASPARRNSTVILVTNALQHLSHPMVDKILVLGDGCVQEVGTFAELSSDQNSRFAAFLKTITETSTTAIEVPLDVDVDGDDASEDDLDINYGGDEPEVTKIISVERRQSRSSSFKISSMRRLDSSVQDAETSKGDDSGAIMTIEEKVTGSVDRQVYIAWAKAGGGASVAILILGMFVVVELLNVSSKWWLTYWSQSGGSHAYFYLGIYGLINFSAIFATFFRLILFVLVGLRASRSMFEQLLDVVLEAPMSFFDTTPIGRIINRFSKDMYTVDEQLVVSSRSYLVTLLNVLSAIFVVTAVTPMFLIGLVPIMIFYVQQQRFFTMSYRELKRLDSVSRSPIYALLGETIDGVLTIRAFEAEKSLSSRMVKMLDSQQTAYYLTFVAQNWLSIRLEFAGTMIVMCACLVAVMGHNQLGGNEHFAGLAGLSISFALSITSTLNWTVRMASDMEGNFVAVERIQQYSRIPGEAPRSTQSDETLALNWPVEGRIEFINAKLKYRPGLPLVLKGLNISIPAKSKVGVVGRTGAGKSTLMVALLRIVELHAGSIEIDGIDIKSLGLKKLRSMIAVIPQDPVLFSGNVRTNLDPFGEYDDAKLFEVLEHVGLYVPLEKVSSKSSLSSLGSEIKAGGRTQPIKSLSEEVSAGGNNFSVGQRQLIVIARAMLTGASIVIMDEATASVDADTDARIQRVFRSEFNNATCITVAHRLNTIMDSDFVLVMDDGQAAEFDKPSLLLSKENGIFKSLVDAWEDEN